MLCLYPTVFNGNRAACGQCTSCRINHKLRWMGRMALESKYAYPGTPGSFITLTYKDEELPKDGSLDRTHLKKFIQKLKERVAPTERYFAVGEYGTKFFRPHFHVIHFGGFGNEAWNRIYESCWSTKRGMRGFVQTSPANINRQSYVTGYVTKKLDGRHQQRIEDLGLSPEYMSASLKPTLGTTGLHAMSRFFDDGAGRKHSGGARVSARIPSRRTLLPLFPPRPAVFSGALRLR